MEKRCDKCGHMNKEYQNFCVECGNALAQNAPQSNPPMPHSWQGSQAIYPSKPLQSPPAGQHYQNYQNPQPQIRPDSGSAQVDYEFEKSKGFFLSMITAHKHDADPAKRESKIAPRQYPALKLYMTLMRIIAWILSLGILITAIIGFIFYITRLEGIWWLGLIGLLVSILVSFLTMSMWYASIDIIRLKINTEDNTRRAANK